MHSTTFVDFMLFDLIDNTAISVECPVCEYTTDLLLREARLEILLLCAGCRRYLRFIEDGTTRSEMRRLREADENMRRAMDEINRTGLFSISMRRKS